MLEGKSFFPKSLDWKEEHQISQQWFLFLLNMLNSANLRMTVYPQNDGSLIYAYADDHAGKSYRIQVWPDGRVLGSRKHD